MLLGPQIPKSTPRYEEIKKLFSKQESLDTLIGNAVFAVGILCESQAINAAVEHDETYLEAARSELEEIEAKFIASGLATKIKLALLYIPLVSKSALVKAFDTRLKGLQ